MTTAATHQPLVTIVTPSYNQAPFLRATIESVLRQDYPRIEYIIIDGGSTDSSAAIAAEYSSRLAWISEPDRGQSHAINKGFRQARGEYLAWLNSDDVLLDGAVSRAVNALLQNPGAGAIYGEGYLIDRDGAVTRRFPYTQPFDLWRLCHLSDYILQQSVFFRRSVFDAVGYLREDLHYTMDWDLLIRIGKRFPVVAIPEFLGCLREYPETKSSAGGIRRVREIRAVLREHSGLRFPPGWIVYGLETYGQIWCEGIRRRVPGFLARPAEVAQFLLIYACGYVAGRTLRASQGLYSDGWAGPRLHYMLTSGCGSFRVRGMLPPTGWLAGQSLEVRVCGETLGRYQLSLGSFSLEVPVPPALQSTPLEIEIRATHTWVPAYSTGRADFRRLCYLLEGIDRIEAVDAPAAPDGLNRMAMPAC